MIKAPAHKLKVWYVREHDEHTIAEVLLPAYVSGHQWIRDANNAGGCWIDGFVPWHRINHIRIEFAEE